MSSYGTAAPKESGSSHEKLQYHGDKESERDEDVMSVMSVADSCDFTNAALRSSHVQEPYSRCCSPLAADEVLAWIFFRNTPALLFPAQARLAGEIHRS